MKTIDEIKCLSESILSIYIYTDNENISTIKRKS